jgi:hypothetical protein
MATERLTVEADTKISPLAEQAAAAELGCAPGDVTVVGVDGGYSRNRRSLVGYSDNWLFAKEVDKDVLPGDGAEELWWLQKDDAMASTLRAVAPELVSDWSKLSSDGHVLLMTSYRTADGWLWSLPETPEQQHAYIQAVINAIKRLEPMTFDEATINELKLQPCFRDELALDDGLALIIQNEAIRTQLTDKYTAMVRDESLVSLHEPLKKMQALLDDESALRALALRARQLIEQPNDSFGHCDVRSDNLAYHPETGEVKLVDWNWASFATKGFGATEFLTDMARRGVDVRPWYDELNVELLAASVGFYARRCLKDPLTPGSTLRDMQAQSAAVALSLYEAAQADRV